MATALRQVAFFTELDRRIAERDLLQHPFYRAWEKGDLTREDLRTYACEYYHQVAAFPTYLSTLHARLEDGPARRAVLRNLAGEEIQGTAHSELWLDFAVDMGAGRAEAREHRPVAEVAELIEASRALAAMARPAAALASFYAYESQVPRIAATKARGLKAHYGAGARGTRYFTLHAVADVAHAAAWRELIADELDAHPEDASAAEMEALDAAEATARALWRALDGIERERLRTLSSGKRD